MQRFIVLSMICLCFLACHRAGPPDVLLITVDTLRYDFCSPKWMPRTVEHFRKDFRFTHARVTSPLTITSHTALMTGLPPDGMFDNGRLKPGAVTMAEFLKAHGYATAAFLSGFPLDRRFGLDQGFDLYDDRFVKAEATMLKDIRQWNGWTFEAFDRRGDYTIGHYLEWLARPASGPRFAWIHLFDVHYPYRPDKNPYDPDFFKARTPEEITHLRQAYGEEAAFVDEQLARVWNAVAGGRTLIILTSDHGEDLCEHDNYLSHGDVLYETNLHIPLFLHLPGLRGREIAEPVLNLDVVPTLASLLKFPPLPATGLDLSDLLKKGSPLSRRLLYAECRSQKWGAGAAVINGNWKYIAQPGLRNMLFRLDQDPGERKNLIDEFPDEAARLHKHIERWWKDGRVIDPLSPLLTDPERIRAFRALGYIQ
jgi:arylsulfatase A-like enzyme